MRLGLRAKVIAVRNPGRGSWRAAPRRRGGVAGQARVDYAGRSSSVPTRSWST